jgi:hypothetical protein
MMEILLWKRKLDCVNTTEPSTAYCIHRRVGSIWGCYNYLRSDWVKRDGYEGHKREMLANKYSTNFLKGNIFTATSLSEPSASWRDILGTAVPTRSRVAHLVQADLYCCVNELPSSTLCSSKPLSEPLYQDFRIAHIAQANLSPNRCANAF